MATRDGRLEIVAALAAVTDRVTVDYGRRPTAFDPPNLFSLTFNELKVSGAALVRFKGELAALLPDVGDEIIRLRLDEDEDVGAFAVLVREMLAARAREVLEERSRSGQSDVVWDKDDARKGIHGGAHVGEADRDARTPRGGKGAAPKPPKPRLTRGPAGGRKERVVNTGFAETASPRTALGPTSPLRVDKEYLFWLEVGRLQKGSIETNPGPLPTDRLPPRAVLKVALYTFDGEFQLTHGADVGEIRLNDDETADVVRQPGGGAAKSASDTGRRRLYFPVRTPKTVGTARLRCNIYYEQILVQSRLVTARVMRRPQPAERSLTSTLDYTLSRTLAASLTARKPHTLSLMLNDNGNGTHAFRFFGREDFKNDATFDAHQLADWIKRARGAMRRAAWGDEEVWKPGKGYLYDGAKDDARLKSDLIRFALRGYRFFNGIIRGLAGGATRAERDERERRLTELMATPGRVQIALKQSARFVLPATLIYDHPLDTGAKPGEYSLCEEFGRAYVDKTPLEESACFQGRCPSRGALTVVCPGGFWGYRHAIGLPLSIGSAAPDVPAALSWEEGPELLVGVSTDNSFRLRQAHEAALRAISGRVKWNYAATRADTLRMLKERRAQLVYFYCHGGVSGRVPYIQVGPTSEPGITPDNLRALGVRWEETRPLVFINGCHTAALEPDVAIEFISDFVEVAGASGVIGTEITIFESLAGAFAEECLRRFLLGTEIGDAVRSARLKLLKDGNPLGLVYIPYVISDLHLSEQAAPAVEARKRPPAGRKN